MTSDKDSPVRNDTTPRSDRDRFVAFAFCWADMLIEIDATHTVVFAAGPTEALISRSPAALQGQPVLQLFNETDRALVTNLLNIAAKQGRFDNTTIRLQGAGGPTQPLDMAGYHLSDMDGHYYLALRLASVPRRRSNNGAPLQRDTASGLYDADSFTAIVGDLLKDTDDTSEMTLIALNGLDDMRGRMEEDAEEAFMSALGTSLRANSLDGDAAAQVADDRYIVVHESNVGALDLQQQIASLARSADPTGKGLEIETASVNTVDTGISDEDMANGLIYTINQFRSAQGSDFNMKSLSTSLSSLVSEAVNSVQQFRTVLSTGDFDVAFQPIVDITRGDIHHYEALCRFRGNEAGESPYRYITFAEETGLIPDFDLAMADKVIRWLREHGRDRKVSVAVNVSGHSVASLPYVVGLHTLLKENAWVRDKLVFEITESARMEDLEGANKFIQGLRGQGFEVCLDDFGAGAANFQYLSTLEVDVVKLDGSAVRNAQRAKKGEAFLKALVNLCSNLGVETIAEMIDDQKGLSFIRRCGVDYAQGYIFGKPSTDINDFNDTRPDHLFPGRQRR